MPAITLQNVIHNTPSITNGQTQPVTVAQAGAAGQQTDWENQLGPAYQLELSQGSAWSDPEVRELKRTGKIECQTCKTRTYQDVSNDPGVSFKAPGHIAPENSAAMVQSHEQEHVANEQAAASNEGRRVVSQNVRVFTSICPECGKSYVSGGETQTVTANAEKPQEAAVGENIDMLL